MNFFSKIRKELFPERVKYLDVQTDELYDSVKDLLKAWRMSGRKVGTIRRLEGEELRKWNTRIIKE